MSASPEESAGIAERLGRYREGEVTLGGVPLDTLPVEQVRRHILVAENSDTLLSGVLRDELAAGRTGEELAAALRTANAVAAHVRQVAQGGVLRVGRFQAGHAVVGAQREFRNEELL
ncbi:hypothetical protein ABZV75_09865 [Streptomyces flaveolus]|uniref:hypothetical protein n=1 Tax=Streptomyces flaveolus TaxID=67297 RepID=UPI0033A6912B